MTAIDRLIAFGDSWTFGSELRDPAIPDCTSDYDGRNDAHRLRHAWPAVLGQLLGAAAVQNLGTAARSNDTICRDLRSWLAREGYLSGRDTRGLLICIGWTSPERRDFFFRSPDELQNPDQGWMTMYPMWSHAYAHPALDQFSRLYVQHFWHPEEYLQRWITQLVDTQHLLRNLGIRNCQFQAFYQHHHQLIADWDDETWTAAHGLQPDLREMWRSLDGHSFMHRDDARQTFHNHIRELGTDMFSGNHPSERGHAAWAEHMARWIGNRSDA